MDWVSSSVNKSRTGSEGIHYSSSPHPVKEKPDMVWSYGAWPALKYTHSLTLFLTMFLWIPSILGALSSPPWTPLRRCGSPRRNMRKTVPDPSTGKPSNVETSSSPLSEVNSTLKLAFLSRSVCEELPVCVNVCVGTSMCAYASAVWPRDPRAQQGQ